jgi:hypothetical protein
MHSPPQNDIATYIQGLAFELRGLPQGLILVLSRVGCGVSRLTALTGAVFVSGAFLPIRLGTIRADLDLLFSSVAVRGE